MVVPIGSFAGGEICLVEPGLVLPLRSGDAVVFPSMDFTHFNLPYTGTRASLVFKSDASGVSWKEHQNGWSSSMYAPAL